MLFRRKKVEEKELDIPVKKIRRRKKLEPVKPWSRKERFIVFFFLLLIPVLSLTFVFKSKNKTSLINNTKVLGAITTSPAIGELKSKIINELQGRQATYGIWLQALDGSYALGINERETFDGASLFKLPLMIGFYEEVQKGNISEDTNYTIKYSDAQLGAGVLATYSPGTVVTYRDVIKAMGKDSDNTAFGILENALDPNLETKVINEIGMKDTIFDESLTTPSDIGMLFYKLSNTNIISDSAKKELLNSLTNTQYETLIPAGIPSNIEVPHKYASELDALNDAGIIYAKNPFVLVIMSKGASDEAQSEIPKITKLVYDFLNK